MATLYFLAAAESGDDGDGDLLPSLLNVSAVMDGKCITLFSGFCCCQGCLAKDPEDRIAEFKEQFNDELRSMVRMPDYLQLPPEVKINIIKVLAEARDQCLAGNNWEFAFEADINSPDA